MAHHRHKRDTNARHLPSARTVAGGIAVLATVPAVTIGVLSANPETHDLVATDAIPTGGTSAGDPADRAPVLSRGDTRADRRAAVQADGTSVRMATQQARKAALAATLQAVRQADTHRWTTTDLNLWTESGPVAVKVGEIAAGKRVLVTGREAAGRVEIVVDGRSRWVTAGYLDTEPPVAAAAPAAAGLSMAPCPDGSVENGLTENAVRVYRAVCHAFPQITTYGGWDAHGEHASGKALDIMTSDVTLGTAIADFLQAHASELHLYDVIWRQHIWTPVRASEGWRYMPSRGSITANHYDHVHVSTY